MWEPRGPGEGTLLLCDQLSLAVWWKVGWRRAGSELVLGGSSHTPALLLIIATQGLRRPLGKSQTLASIRSCVSYKVPEAPQK